MDDPVVCPVCTMPDPLIAVDGYECATCGHEWLGELDDDISEVIDSLGNVLASGDDVVV